MAHLANIFTDMQLKMGQAPGSSFQTGFYFVLVLLVFGFALKAALAPFISWLPDAHPSAPAPISSLLSGVLIKVLGAYALARIVFNVYGFARGGFGDPWVFNALIILGVASIMVGGLLALVQKGYKRLLADSSLSQIGYIVLGFGIGNVFAIVGALTHILAHALGKGLMFLTSGSVEYRMGEKDTTKLPRGLGKQMPWTSLSYNLGALSVAGVPPFLGFFSKMFIMEDTNRKLIHMGLHQNRLHKDIPKKSLLYLGNERISRGCWVEIKFIPGNKKSNWLTDGNIDQTKDRFE
jgi:formate hydrogenlyase subunit 3/multisubunit Na+/H+ antiporter MnhD subunit